MIEWGIFTADSADWTAAESLEAQFYSREEAESAVLDRYTDEDETTVHVIEDEEEDEEEDEDCD